jgi:VWFA-related protein
MPPLRQTAGRGLACAGLALWPALAAGQSNTTAAPPILEITTVSRVVDVYATVKDAKGRLVTTLGRDQFELREDGVPQQVDYFANETDAPLRLGLLIDTSASQAGILATEREKALEFLRAVLGPADEAFVVRFDREVVPLQGLTKEMPLLASAIEEVRADPATRETDPPEARRPRGTRLYDAIQQASDLLAGENGRKVLVLLTDGEDQGSHVTRDGALEAAERAEAMIYSVLVADPLFYWARGRDFKGEAALAALQGKTGGSMIRPETGGGLREIASELRAQYRLGYMPRKARYDGSFRRLEVRLRGRYTVHARRGYYATAE